MYFKISMYIIVKCVKQGNEELLPTRLHSIDYKILIRYLSCEIYANF